MKSEEAYQVIAKDISIEPLNFPWHSIIFHVEYGHVQVDAILQPEDIWNYVKLKSKYKARNLLVPKYFREGFPGKIEKLEKVLDPTRVLFVPPHHYKFRKWTLGSIPLHEGFAVALRETGDGRFYVSYALFYNRDR